MPFVSIIIPVYNDWNRLRICLQALEEQTYAADQYEVLVVDNNSDPPVTGADRDFPHVRVILERQQSSYAARNTGLNHARGEVIAFTDSDCIPAADWVEKGVSTLEREPDCGLIGGKVELFFQAPGRPTAVELCDSFMHLTQQFFVEYMRFSVTANLFTTRLMFERVGTFNAHAQSGGDNDWGQRVFSLGYPLVYADDVRVSHPARSSFLQLQRKQLRVARGSKDHIDWRTHLPPLTWTYESILLRLPPLPPVFKVMRRRDIGFVTKVETLLIWGLMQVIRSSEKWRLTCLRVLRASKNV